MTEKKLTVLEPSTPVYFFHESLGYIEGVIQEIVKASGKSNSLRYVISSSAIEDQVTVKAKFVFEKRLIQQAEDQCSIKSQPVHDLLDLLDLNEASLQVVVEKRFLNDDIYTYIGPIVLAINPFKWDIPHVQDDQMVHYMNSTPNLRPHSWSVADNAFRSMIRGEGNQSILVSGISGAGKTEAAKTVTKYLTALSTTRTRDPEKKRMASSIATKIQESSPILEAFGNSKTVNNDNSSRFGKFIKLSFDKDGIILGGTIIQYLLERSRVIAPGPNERGYHIFYQLLAGASDADRAKYKLADKTSFPCLETGNCTTVDTIDDVEDYRNTRTAMDIIGLTPEEQDSVFTVLSAILHLSLLTFSGNHDDSAFVQNRDALATVAELLQIDADKLEMVLVTKKLIIMNNSIIKRLNIEGACDARDALMKALYVNVFDWLIRKINEKIAPTSTPSSFIGLLDIFGFEEFQINSFEQLCINYSNETLQHHYNSVNFKRDMKECKEEGIDVTTVKFNDNTPCIELIKGSKTETGILGLLDTQCSFPKATDQTFTNLIKQTFYKKHKYFDAHPVKHEEFYIRHYAGKIEYNTQNWLEKNKDELKDDIFEALCGSTSKFVSALVPPPTRVRGKLLTVGGHFKSQLDELLEIINGTLPHWIRCIKPHPSKKPNMFHKIEVLNQLRSSGVLATIRMRRDGFSVRLLHKYFWDKFKVVQKGTIDEASDLVTKCMNILKEAGLSLEEAQVGKTKVFLRPHAYSEIEKKRSQALSNTATIIQKYTKMFLAYMQVERMHKRIHLEKLKKEISQRKKDMEYIRLMREQRDFILSEIDRKNTIYTVSIKDYLSRRKDRLSLLSDEKKRFQFLRKEKELRKQIEEEERRRAAEERARLIAALEEEKRQREIEAKRKYLEEKMEKERKKREEEEKERERRRKEIRRMEKEASIKRRKELELQQLTKMQKRAEEQEKCIEEYHKRKERARRIIEEEQMRKANEKRERALEAIRQKEQRIKEEENWEKHEYRRLRHEYAAKYEKKLRKEAREKQRRLQTQRFLRMEELQLEEKDRILHEKLLRTTIRRKELQEKQNEILFSKSSQFKHKVQQISASQEERERAILRKQEEMDLIKDRERKLKEMKKRIKAEFDQMKLQRDLEERKLIEKEQEIEASLKVKRFENSLERSHELEVASSPQRFRKSVEYSRSSPQSFSLDLSKVNKSVNSSAIHSARSTTSTSSRTSIYQDFTSSGRKQRKAGMFSLYS